MFGKLKRRVQKKTDYKQRLGLLKSGKPRIVVRKSLKRILSQIVSYEKDGDKVVMSASSGELGKFGWLGGNNLPAAYLTGFLLGSKARKNGVNEAVLDMGLHVSTKGNKIYAFVMGCNDAGLVVPFDKKISPEPERAYGKHIEEHAKKIKEDDAEKYSRYFSSYIKKGLAPEEISKHLEDVKRKINDSFGKK